MRLGGLHERIGREVHVRLVDHHIRRQAQQALQLVVGQERAVGVVRRGKPQQFDVAIRVECALDGREVEREVHMARHPHRARVIDVRRPRVHLEGRRAVHHRFARRDQTARQQIDHLVQPVAHHDSVHGRGAVLRQRRAQTRILRVRVELQAVESRNRLSNFGRRSVQVFVRIQFGSFVHAHAEPLGHGLERKRPLRRRRRPHVGANECTVVESHISVHSSVVSMRSRAPVILPLRPG